MAKTFDFKHALTNIRLIVCSLLLAGIVGTISIIGSYTLPTTPMQKNVVRSTIIYDLEKDRYAYAPSLIDSQMDNFTDAVMLNISAYDRANNLKQIVINAMLNPRYNYDMFSYKVDNLQAYRSSENRAKFYTAHYGRYWHGYVILLKPLLMFFNMSDIRIINMSLQTLLLLYLMLLLYQMGGKKLALPYLSAILIFNPISSAMCLQYACMYYITMISNIILLKYKLYKSDKWWLFFLWVGIVTPFFDFLTYPLTALGCNLILFILLTDDKLYAKMTKVIIASVAWGCGYAFMWAQKWLIGSILTGANLLSNALHQAQVRTGNYADIEQISILKVIFTNMQDYYNHIFMALLILLILILCFVFMSGKYKIKINFSTIIPLLFVSVYPFIWLAVLSNHSAIHHWMTHKIFMISILAIIYGIFYSLTPKTKIIKSKTTVKDIFRRFIKLLSFLICCSLIIWTLIICAQKYLPHSTTARADISAAYTENPTFLVHYNQSLQPLPEAAWMPKLGNRGVVVQKAGHQMDFTITALQDVDITIFLRGPDVRNAEGKRKEKWVEYTSFAINGESIKMDNPQVWHDKPFTYTFHAKQNNLYQIKLKWRHK